MAAGQEFLTSGCRDSSLPTIEVKNLKTYFNTPEGVGKAVHGVSFKIEKGKTYALVGESGCGKTITALSIIQLLPPAGYIANGEILLNGRDIIPLSEREKRTIRGGKISMIFQEPMTSLNPVFTIGEQIVEAIKLHQKGVDAKKAALEMLEKVKLPHPESLFSSYPHTLSGGMRQRVMIAIALSCRPDLLIADEPTTALDVTIQEEILRLIKELQIETSTALLLITHNLAIVYQNADYIGVMYGGKLVEEADAKSLFRKPLHPYTIKLLRSTPTIEKRGEMLDTIPGVVPPSTSMPPGCGFAGRCHMEMEGCFSIEPSLIQRENGHLAACHLYDSGFMSSPYSKPLKREEKEKEKPLPRPAYGEREVLMEIKNLKCYYSQKKGILKRETSYIKAVDGIGLTIRKGSTLALVGESGCGKTTVGKTIIRLIEPFAGSIVFEGKDITKIPLKELKPLRSIMQIIFQDPYSALNPRLMVGEIIEEGLKALKPWMDKKERKEAVLRTLDMVGLTPDMIERYPHEFSGGQRQRIGIARALVVEPRFIALDEPTSSLDVSIQAQILNLIKSIQRELGLAFLFITHDLGVVEYMADEVAIMRDGKIVERGRVGEVFSNPKDPYTVRLLSAVPRIGR